MKCFQEEAIQQNHLSPKYFYPRINLNVQLFFLKKKKKKFENKG